MDDIGYPRQYDGELDASGPPSILDPRPDGPASRFAERFRGPVRAWAVSTFAGWVVMASLTIGLGLLLVAELLPEGVGAWDRSISSWFVAQRIGTLNTASEVGSLLGSTFVVIGLAVLVGIVLALGRHWLAIGFLAAGLLIEVGAFLAATFAVSRPRPSVPQLDVAPPTSSFPSGHTAAALVLYMSVAIIVWTLSDSRVLRVLFWSLAVLVPVFVAMSRLYRGMHHATDVLGSLVLAAGALACAVVVTRVSTAAASPHRTQVQPSAATSVEAPAVPA
jgi:undecaprenyl-diphosphatase